MLMVGLAIIIMGEDDDGGAIIVPLSLLPTKSLLTAYPLAALMGRICPGWIGAWTC